MTYPELLQTISTGATVVGVGTAVYATLLARHVRGAVGDVKQSVDQQTEHMKAAIKQQTKDLKS